MATVSKIKWGVFDKANLLSISLSPWSTKLQTRWGTGMLFQWDLFFFSNHPKQGPFPCFVMLPHNWPCFWRKKKTPFLVIHISYKRKKWTKVKQPLFEVEWYLFHCGCRGLGPQLSTAGCTLTLSVMLVHLMSWLEDTTCFTRQNTSTLAVEVEKYLFNNFSCYLTVQN